MKKIVTLLMIGCVWAQAGHASLSVEQTNDCTQLMSKFGFGVSPDAYQRFCTQNNLSALKAELKRQASQPPALPSNLRGLPKTDYYAREYNKRMNWPRGNDQPPHVAYARQVSFVETAHRIHANATADNQFAERMAHFWSNHFSVSRAKNSAVRLLIGAMEREAIRANMYGNFADMLIAVSQHPAMLDYLENTDSVGEMSVIGMDSTKRGINENLAREILELHTLGVNGGYSQRDVQELAKVISGWTWDGERGGFVVNAEGHEPGAKTVLGKTYFATSPTDAPTIRKEGEAVLRALAMHPSTAKFLAEKMARHFVQDNPTPSMINQLAGAYLGSGGNLVAMYGALLDLPEVNSGTFQKYPMPYDVLVGMMRMYGTGVRGNLNDMNTGIKMRNAMQRMSEYMLWNWATPDGWPDTMDYWRTPQQMIRIIESCNFLIHEDIGSNLAPEKVLERNFGAEAAEPYIAMMQGQPNKTLKEKRSTLCAVQLMRNR